MKRGSNEGSKGAPQPPPLHLLLWVLRRTYSLPEFERAAASFAGRMLGAGAAMPPAAAEAHFWRELEAGQLEVEYGSDLEGTAFSALPTDALALSPWNLRVGDSPALASKPAPALRCCLLSVRAHCFLPALALAALQIPGTEGERPDPLRGPSCAVQWGRWRKLVLRFASLVMLPSPGSWCLTLSAHAPSSLPPARLVLQVLPRLEGSILRQITSTIPVRPSACPCPCGPGARSLAE